ncbi:MAG: hypothetical protein K2N87_16910 [Eubacterium sp.]|nr:hypothetical protein [Eubacterium sp.]
MIHQIKTNQKLVPYLCNEIEDYGIHVEVDENLTEEKYAVIKVDDFYNGLHLSAVPKSIDFLAAVDCECDAYLLYLLELKNVKNPKFLIIKDIHEKFQNTIDDFLTDRFGEIFLNDRYRYKDIKLYLISDAYSLQGKYKNFEQYKAVRDKIDKRDSLKIDCSLGGKIYKFKNKVVRIQYEFPPNPVIRRILT